MGLPCYKSLLQFVGHGQQSRSQECSQQCSTSWAWQIFRVSQVWAVGFYKELMQIWILHQCWACDHSKKCSENTVASHHSPQAYRSPRATQERLQTKLWLILYHQKFARTLWTISCYKRLPQLIGYGCSPRGLEYPQQCSTSWAGQGSRVMCTCRFYQTNAVLTLALSG